MLPTLGGLLGERIRASRKQRRERVSALRAKLGHRWRLHPAMLLCGGCVAAIGAKLNKLVKEDEWSVDLKSPDKVLEVTADVPADKIIAAVTDAGFKAEQL